MTVSNLFRESARMIFLCVCLQLLFALTNSDSQEYLHPLPTSEKEWLLVLHNKYRSDAALNNLGNDINALFWDNGLEKASQEWLSKCIYDYDSNRTQIMLNKYSNDASFVIPSINSFHIGVNIDLINSFNATDSFDTTFDNIKTTIFYWNELLYDYTYSNIYNEYARNYLQLIWSKTRYVGCSYYSCPNGVTWSNGTTRNSNSVGLFQCYYFPSMFTQYNDNSNDGNGAQDGITNIGYPYTIAKNGSQLCGNCDIDRCRCTDPGICDGCMNPSFQASYCKNGQDNSNQECGITPTCCTDGLGTILSGCNGTSALGVDYCDEWNHDYTTADTADTPTPTVVENENNNNDNNSMTSTASNGSEMEYEWQDIPLHNREFEIRVSAKMEYDWEVSIENLTISTILQQYPPSEVLTWNKNEVEFEMTNFMIILLESNSDDNNENVTLTVIYKYSEEKIDFQLFANNIYYYNDAKSIYNFISNKTLPDTFDDKFERVFSTLVNDNFAEMIESRSKEESDFVKILRAVNEHELFFNVSSIITFNQSIYLFDNSLNYTNANIKYYDITDVSSQYFELPTTTTSESPTLVTNTIVAINDDNHKESKTSISHFVDMKPPFNFWEIGIFVILGIILLCIFYWIIVCIIGMKQTVKWSKVSDRAPNDSDNVISNIETIGSRKRHKKNSKIKNWINKKFGTNKNKNNQNNNNNEKNRLQSLDLGIITPAGQGPFDKTSLNNTAIKLGKSPIVFENKNAGAHPRSLKTNKHRSKSYGNINHELVDVRKTQHALYTIGNNSDSDRYADSEDEYDDDDDNNEDSSSLNSNDALSDDNENDEVPLNTKKGKKRKEKKNKLSSIRESNTNDDDYNDNNDNGDENDKLVKGISRGIFKSQVDIVELPIISNNASDNNTNTAQNTASAPASDNNEKSDKSDKSDSSEESSQSTSNDDSNDSNDSNDSDDSDESELSQLSSNDGKKSKRKNESKDIRITVNDGNQRESKKVSHLP